MPSLDSIKQRGRGFLVRSTRACVTHDRLPLIVKLPYVAGCHLLLQALGIKSDETPLESEYGTKFVAGLGNSWLDAYLRYRGVWEPVLSEFILRHVQDGDVCVDVGANVGYFSLLFAQRVGASGKVIAIEAAPDTARRLWELSERWVSTALNATGPGGPPIVATPTRSTAAPAAPGRPPLPHGRRPYP